MAHPRKTETRNSKIEIGKWKQKEWAEACPYGELLLQICKGRELDGVVFLYFSIFFL